MTQTNLSLPRQGKQPSENYLTTEEQLALVSQIQERTKLLKKKKAGLTLEEMRIRLRGERALKTLVHNCHRLIWSLINRFNFSDRLSNDELYQIGIITVERAANSYNPNWPGKPRNFTAWVFFLLRQKFRNLFKRELGLERKRATLHEQIRANARLCNDDTSLEFAIFEELKQLLKPILKTLTFHKQGQAFRAFYLQGETKHQIAISLGMTDNSVRTYLYEARKQLRGNPQIRELAGLC
ncbi:MAG: sigma-70 family RNA polymerase sigma factor [Acaryochloris sp. RU_4_1]|nr:sigma-70 family RNA polymerase sigma factor [Acaryochloris sp. RU_4_1]NJR56971.1 sigma-70 family RNA polymerase sigma factor [Acaryochloris sp. CRU_2_0]